MLKCELISADLLLIKNRNTLEAKGLLSQMVAQYQNISFVNIKATAVCIT